MGALATASKVALFPGWFLWRAYLGLWWAFDDATILRMRRGSVRRGEGTVGPAPGADGAAKVSPIAARAREALAAPPRWLLVTGFLGTLATSASAGAVVGVANGGGGMAPDAAWLAWSIATLTAAMGTVLIIRAHHLRHRRRVARAIVGAMARGVRAGAALYAEAFPLLKTTVLTWGNYGNITIPKILGVNHWLIIILFAVGTIFLFRWLEKNKL